MIERSRVATVKIKGARSRWLRIPVVALAVAAGLAVDYWIVSAFRGHEPCGGNVEQSGCDDALGQLASWLLVIPPAAAGAIAWEWTGKWTTTIYRAPKAPGRPGGF